MRPRCVCVCVCVYCVCVYCVFLFNHAFYCGYQAVLLLDTDGIRADIAVGWYVVSAISEFSKSSWALTV